MAHAESVGGGASHESHERLNPSGRLCVAEEHYSVLQQRSGLRDDATNSVAHPLQQRIACCNGAQCDNAELLHESAVCCNGVSGVATALSATTQDCCTRAQCVATAHRMLKQRTILLRNRSTLNLLQRVATVQPVVMPVAAQGSLLWRNRTCCEKRTTT